MQRLCSLIKDHQGNVIMGNPNAYTDGNLTPTVIMDPSHDSPLMKTEIFGPILPIITFQKIDEAIAFINKNDKPLVIYYFGSLWGSNFGLVRDKTSSGAIIQNETII